MPPPTLTRLALALAAALLLGACAGADKPRTRYYLLGPLADDTPALPQAPRDPPLALDIAALRLPQYLQRPQIVTRSADNELVLAEYHQWGGNLAKDLMQVLARNLSRLLATPEITVFSRRPPSPPDVRIEIDVLRFERAPDRRVLLSAQWRLRPGDGDGPSLARITDLASAPLDPAAGMDATVAAMSQLAGELSRIIAAAVAARARG